MTGQEFGIQFGIIILRDIINRYICAESADQSILLDVCRSIWKVPHGIRANKGADQLRHRVELNSSTERSGEPNKPSEPANLTHSSFEHLRWLTHSHSGTAFAIPFTCCHMSICLHRGFLVAKYTWRLLPKVSSPLTKWCRDHMLQ